MNLAIDLKDMSEIFIVEECIEEQLTMAIDLKDMSEIFIVKQCMTRTTMLKSRKLD